MWKRTENTLLKYGDFMKIIEQKDQPLFSRKEITAEANYEKATPSKQDVKTQLAPLLKAKEDLVVIKNIVQAFGARTAKIIAYVYDSEAQMKKMEHKKKPKKKGEKSAEEEKSEEKPAESKEAEKKEKPSEEKKEDKAEEKPAEPKEKENPKKESEEKPKEK